MELSKEEKIIKFHFEEILLILFICASNLTEYDKEDLILFTEDIEGRVEGLFSSDYLRTIQSSGLLKVDENIIQDFERLKNILVGMYASQWHNKMRQNGADWMNVNMLAKRILDKINVGYMEPNSFKDDGRYLNVDWI